MKQKLANKLCRDQESGRKYATGQGIGMALTMVIAVFTQTANTADAQNNQSSSWNSYVPDARALGHVAISASNNSFRAPGESDNDRVATYLVPFEQAGTYDLYVRIDHGGTMFFSRVFGYDYQWQQVNGLDIPEGEFTWVNLSERFNSSRVDLTYTVAAPGNQILGIAGRNRGHLIDAFAFGLTDKTFTDAQLSAAALGHPEPGLVGFQAESAISFGDYKLTENGQRLMAQYEQMLAATSAEIAQQLPAIDPEKQKEIQDLLAALKLRLVNYELEQVAWRQAVEHPESNLRTAQRNADLFPIRLANAEVILQNALAMDDDHEDKARAVEEAQNRLNRTKNSENRVQNRLAAAERQIDGARANRAKHDAELQVGTEATARSYAALADAVGALDIENLLASDALDQALAIHTVISEASPFKLAIYAQQGPEYEQRIEQLLGSKPFMIQMLVADGPTGNQFGPALEIYEAILAASPRAEEGLFQRLALAVALEHAEPIRLSVAAVEGDEPQFADPVQRYLSYEKAFLNGELDPGFESLDTWSLRMVVNGDEPDEISAWGREMLRNFRPDQITRDDGRRYSQIVDSDIPYGSQFFQMGWDRDDLNLFQNILANSGICGRRAFFARFILRAFGNPTTARSEHGHAALVRWTPDGWVPYLGGGWGTGNRVIFHHYPSDLDFRASTQARMDSERFIKVKRAQWIANAQGEGIQFGYHDRVNNRDRRKYTEQSPDEIAVPDFWNIVSSVTQHAIIRDLDAKAREAADTESDESKESQTEHAEAGVGIPATERKITVNDDGVIHVPAAASSEPTDSTDGINFMPSFLGGVQVYLGRQVAARTLEYTINAPEAGKYHLTAKLVTPAPKQHLFLTVNDSAERINVDLPYTIGMWAELDPVEVELKQGANTLSFQRGHYFQKGVSIRHFTLTPVQ